MMAPFLSRAKSTQHTSSTPYLVCVPGPRSLGTPRGVGLGDNPNPLAYLTDTVTAEDAIAPEDRELVLAGVLGRYFTPVTGLVAGQKLGGVPAGVRKQRESSRGCHQLSEGEEWGGHLRTAPCSEA